jgi:hypothetical protein
MPYAIAATVVVVAIVLFVVIKIVLDCIDVRSAIDNAAVESAVAAAHPRSRGNVSFWRARGRWRYNAEMNGGRDKASENPYEAPQIEASDPSRPASCWLGALGLLGVVVAVAFMFREHGVAGLSMVIGGLAGMGLGSSLSRRLWVTTIGAVVGFTGGTVVGIVIEVTYGML